MANKHVGASLVGALRMEKKFKKTPAGEIPVEWEAIQIEDVADVYGGGTPDRKNPQYWDGSILWATPTDVTKNSGTTISSTKEGITEAGMKNSAATLMPAGSILMTSRATLGYSVINTVPMTTNQGFANFICKEKIYNFFLLYMLQSKADALQRLGAGSTFLEIPKSAIRKLLIPVPPVPEQKKIAEILSAVDEAIEKTDAVLEKTKQLKKGLMQKLLTRGIGHKKFKKTELGEIPAGWEVQALEEIASIRYGLGQPPKIDENGVPMIRATNIKQGRIINTDMLRVSKEHIPASRNAYLKANDIIVVRSGVNTGDATLVTEDWEGSVAGYDLVVSLKPETNAYFYLSYLLSEKAQGYFSSQKDRSAQSHLNSQQLSEIPVPVTSVVEQNKIAEILLAIDNEISQAETSKQNLEKTKKSLMQVLLTGKVRVNT